METDTHEKTQQFIALFLANRRAIDALILALVPNRHDADDLLQETSARMWQNFHRFQPGSNFAAWGCGFVRFSVLDFYRKRQRGAYVTFNEQLVQALADEMEETTIEMDWRLEALRSCMEKIPRKWRTLIEMRYQHGATVKSISQQLNRSVKSTYQALNRMQAVLHECIEATLAERRRG